MSGDGVRGPERDGGGRGKGGRGGSGIDGGGPTDGGHDSTGGRGGRTDGEGGPTGGSRARILARVREALADREGEPHPGPVPPEASAPAPTPGGTGTVDENGPASDDPTPPHPSPSRPAPGGSDPGASTDDASRRRALVDALAARLEANGAEVVRLTDREHARRWLAGFVGEFGTVALSPELDPPPTAAGQSGERASGPGTGPDAHSDTVTGREADPAPGGSPGRWRALRPDLPAADPSEADLAVSVALGAAAQTGSLVLSSREGRRLQVLAPVHLVWVEAADVHPTLGEALEAAKDDLPAVLALHSGPSKSADIGQIMVTGVHGPGRLVAAVMGALTPPRPRRSPTRR